LIQLIKKSLSSSFGQKSLLKHESNLGRRK
jgi:hypothetical protein